MHIFLYGPSGSGKSTVGKQLAENLKLPFVDLDRVIETSAGMAIPQIMEAQGEAAFRDLESAALKNLSGEKDSVIALGGGALLRKENRAVAEKNGQVVLLAASQSTLLERLKSDSEKRPLLAGNLEAKLFDLLASRADHYASFPLQLRVDEKSPAQISREIQTEVGRHRLSAMGEYDVRVGQFDKLPAGDFIVTDENVAKLHLEKIKHALRRDIPSIILPAGEAHKNLATVERIWRAFLEAGLDRKSAVIALGGGVIGDLTGFAAATYMRGIEWIAVPTTLLSMVDASLGGKTGFDLPEGKNLIGAFHPPQLVLADPAFLSTLPEGEFHSGLADVVKHGVISDPALFELCSRGLDWVKANIETIVKRAMTVKISVIEDDPYEKGFRAALNLGHTVGHALELVSGFRLRHGEAVAVGMVVEAEYAARLEIAPKGLPDAIRATLSALGLPVEIPSDLPRAEIIRAMRVDKKRSAKSIRFALPADIGKVELVAVRVMDLETVIGEL
ncbi:MAG: 3-dehydroquinate synthase [Chloroflexi bacterium]|nr:3-dehydroquinate synthase [Chloroflexota bacterium]